jgi:hypothetical protein
MEKNTNKKAAPWWKFGYVWMVFAGPGVVIIASFITLYLAVTRPDPVIAEDYYQQGLDINKTVDTQGNTASLAPAMLARNHAQTGVVAKPKTENKP